MAGQGGGRAESTVKLGLKPAPKSKQGVRMDVESKNQEVNPKMRVCDKRGIQSQELESQRVQPRMVYYGGSKKSDQVKTKKY